MKEIYLVLTILFLFSLLLINVNAQEKEQMFCVKNNGNDCVAYRMEDVETQITIGDVDSFKFEPHLKLKKWGESSLELWLDNEYEFFSNCSYLTGKINLEGDKMEVSFYPKKERQFQETGIIRYINMEMVNPTIMVAEYEMYRHISLINPTIISYRPDKEVIVLYGHHSLEKFFDTENITVPIVRYASILSSSLPMYLNPGVIVLDFHYNNLNISNEEVRSNFNNAIIESFKNYGVTVTKGLRDDWLYYEKDGKLIKFSSSIFDENQYIFYINIGGEKVDQQINFLKPGILKYIVKPILDPIIKYLNIDVGNVQEVNPDIPYSIIDDVANNFISKIGKNIIHDSLNNSEEKILQTLTPILSSDEWIKNEMRKYIGWSEKNIENTFEFDIILKEKPINNIVKFNIKTENLEFFYQPELTQEEKDMGAFRPENVVGSYAVYHDTRKGNEYGTGKAFHIYRPKVVDALGNSTWSILNITENLMTITINQTWLNTATYPITIDPSFGYTTIGASYETINYFVRCSNFSFTGGASNGNSMTAYINSGGTGNKWKYAIYYQNYTKLTNGETAEGTGSTSSAWKTLNFGTSPSLSSQTYYLCALGYLAEKDNLDIYYDSNGYTNRGILHNVASYSYPNPLVPTITNLMHSIFLNYTAAGDSTPPTFSSYSSNTTIANTKVNISVKITDETALSGFIFQTNNTGTWVNTTWVALTSGQTATNITVLNSTVGVVVNVTFYANDSSNNWGTYRASITTTAGVTSYSRNLVDSFTFGESYPNFIKSVRKLSDSSSLNENVNRLGSLGRTQSDTSTFNEIYQRILYQTRLFSEYATEYETTLVIPNNVRLFVEGFTLTENYFRIILLSRFLSDNPTLNELLWQHLEVNIQSYSRELSDYFSLSESSTQKSYLVRTNFDSFTLDEIGLRFFGTMKTIYNFFTYGESPLRQANNVRTTKDYVTLSEVSSRLYDDFRGVLDFATFSESANRKQSSVRTSSDSLSLSEQSSRITTNFRTLLDLFYLFESAVRNTLGFRTVQDTSTFGEIMFKTYGQTQILSEGFTLSESTIRNVNLFRIASDVFNLMECWIRGFFTTGIVTCATCPTCPSGSTQMPVVEVPEVLLKKEELENNFSWIFIVMIVSIITYAITKWRKKGWYSRHRNIDRMVKVYLIFVVVSCVVVFISLYFTFKVTPQEVIQLLKLV